MQSEKFYVKGVTYGPFAPNAQKDAFASPEQTEKDFQLIRQLGANVLRIYTVPPGWLLDLAGSFALKLLVDVPWNKHLCFLDRPETRDHAFRLVRLAAEQCAHHPALFALSVANEIPPDIVRWSGAARVADFIDELVDQVKEIESECLCTSANFPPTEFLRPQNIDFHCFNVYLHYQKPFENYLARLQMIADSKPLILGECGIDSIREGEQRKCEILSWKIETSFRSGLAGAVIYSFTDDWFKGGEPVADWAFGLTAGDRTPKPSFHAVQELFRVAPYFPLPKYPLVSVVIASFNGARTLAGCLESLTRLNYPAYEVILVDDGSTDDTPRIASQFPQFHYVRHAQNLGLSAARNTGIEAARGEIVAFTDADCRADPDWLYYLAGNLWRGGFAGIGGHNLLPPDDSWVAAGVMVSPGGPAHVMLTDRIAEHIPGCNMVFYKSVLKQIGGFDPIFRKAGDDVDVCWRLQQLGYKISFDPAGFVWHYRRATMADYLRQQKGYGEAEALLVYRHPEYFNWFGASQWQGRIYSPSQFGLAARSPMIYHGTFGSAFFQTLYTPPPAATLMLLTSLEYHVLITLPLFVLGAVFRLLLSFGVASFLLSILVCIAAAAQAEVPRAKRRFWSRPLIALLFFLQPIFRGWARYQGRLTVRRQPLSGFESLDSVSPENAQPVGQMAYWSERGLGRIDFLGAIIRELDKKGWQNKSDAGWNHYDVEIYGSRWTHLQLTTASEVFENGRSLIRCRLETEWTFLARLVFWGMCGAELLLIGFLGQRFPWVWLLLLSLPAFDWRLAQEQKDLKRLISVFLDGVARQLNLPKVGLSAPAPKPEVPEQLPI